jgi:hypothetical protein
LPVPRARSAAALAALGLTALLAGCGGSGGADANGFTTADRTAAQTALDTLQPTSISRVLVQISDTEHIPDTCTVHLVSPNPRVFRVFVQWIPHGTDLANGNGYSWLEAVLYPNGKAPALRMGTIPADVPAKTAMHQLESHYGTAFDKPYENCEVLANGRLWGLKAGSASQTPAVTPAG